MRGVINPKASDLANSSRFFSQKKGNDLSNHASGDSYFAIEYAGNQNQYISTARDRVLIRIDELIESFKESVSDKLTIRNAEEAEKELFYAVKSFSSILGIDAIIDLESKSFVNVVHNLYSYPTLQRDDLEALRNAVILKSKQLEAANFETGLSISVKSHSQQESSKSVSRSRACSL